MATAAIDRILGRSERVEAVRAQIRRLVAFDGPGAPSVPTVLIQGETGTGKGLVARVMHETGPRAGGPFIDVNCAAIPEAMLEAELFGFEAGAFTDAKRAKPGLFESAARGTLFLDEIDSLSPSLQGKVLQAIEEKRVRRLGAVAAQQVDAKLVAATQKDLGALVAAGTFRADLYHRLAVLILPLPALRERDGDVVFLAEHYLAWYARAHGLVPKRLTAGGRDWLATRDWPGNVRELEHLMERVTLLGTGTDVDREMLEGFATTGVRAAVAPLAPAPAPAADASDADESASVKAALLRSGGNVVRASRLLGIGRNALRYRMRRLGIDRPDDDDLSPLPEPPKPAPARPVAAPQPPRWEQKHVVVLALALTIPEPSDEIGGYEPWTVATRWEQVIVDRVLGFEGVFVQHSSTRLTAVFGVPRAVEQAAERAVHAALAIQQLVRTADGPRPVLCAAVHVGDVRVDVNAAEPAMHLLPLGDAVSLPERLLGHAGAGEVLVSAPIARRVERTCALERRSLQVGAGTERLTAYAVSGIRQRPASEEGEAVTPFVGRARDLAVLRDAFARAAEGQGQVVFVTGDAGMGKSRLLAELRASLADQPHRWIEGRCASYGRTTAFLPVVDAWRRFYGIVDQDDAVAASEKIAREAARLGEDLDWTLAFVHQALSLRSDDDSVEHLDAASFRSELFRALRVLAMRLADHAPLVLVIEDLHWIDPASEEYIAFVADSVPTARVLLVLSHRTGYRQPFGDRSYHTRISLAPLSGSEMATMAGALLASADVPDALRTLVARKAEGNPFFVEELTRWLVEAGSVRTEAGRIELARELPETAIPDTIQDVIVARIDRLADEARHAIQVASVIGREFALRLLGRITDAGDGISTQVEELRALELIYEKAGNPELAYMFKHALTRDVAYGSVLRERRTALHRTIGLAVEELYADRLAEHYETLAYHFGRGEDWARALTYHERSAEKAAAAHANRAVVEHCRAGLAIAERLGPAVEDEVRRRLEERLAHACFYLSEYAASGTAYEEAAQHSAEPATRALHLGAAAYSYFWGHRYEPSRRCADDALALARTHGVPAAEAQAHIVQGFTAGVHDADLDGFARHLDVAEAINARDPHPGIEGLAAAHRVMLAEWRGDYADAIAVAEGAIDIGRRLRLPEMIIVPTWFLGKARCCMGDFGGAIAVLEEAYALCDRIGDRAWKARLLNTLGWCLYEVANPERAREYDERAATLAREIGDPEILANADVNLALDYLALGDSARALAHLEPIEAALERGGDPWMRWRYALHVRDARARVELRNGAPERALAITDEELAGARRHRATKIEARALVVRAAALLDLERRDDASAAVAEALAVAQRIGYPRGVWKAHRLGAEIARRRGDATAATTHAAAAHAVVERVATSLRDAELRARFVAAASR